MLAFIFAPFYILVNIVLVRWLFRFAAACHTALQHNVFKTFFAVIYLFVASTPITSFFIKNPTWLHRLLKQINNYWLGWMLYFALGVLLTELSIFVIKKVRHKGFEDEMRMRRIQGSAMLVVLVICGTLGMVGARTLHVTNYEVTLDKPGQDLTVALVADLHLGYSSSPEYVAEYVQAINEMQPDIVLLAGDIFDNDITAIPQPDYVAAQLGSLKSTYGTYACWGNHDLNEAILAGFTWQTTDADKRDARMDAFLEQANMQLLSDEVLELPEAQLTIVGRKDPARSRKLGETRADIETLLQGIDLGSTTVIDLEHEPKELQRVADSGVDLALSGHTHNGQLFPGNLTICLAWENPAGLLQKDQMTSIVTEGVGVWGPNMRLGTKSEVVQIIVHRQG